MAFTPSSYLQADGLIFLRDKQHASKLFAADQFRLAPKFSHLFHVSFGINRDTLKLADLTQRHQNEINMLVKSATLPKFTVSTDTVNQYNRKKVIQYTHKFEPVKIKFHDDNMGLINQLWQNYYAYYYADSISAKHSNGFVRNATRNANFITTPYGLDNGSSTPFFSYIKIYHMARHEYVCYKLQNPIITAWDHQVVDYGAKDTHSNDMSIAYEAVSYTMGEVTTENVEGFGIEHYDQTPSPLLGVTAFPAKASPSFAKQLGVINPALEILDNQVESINTYQNTKELTPPGAKDLVKVTPITANGGVPDIVFPQSDSTKSNSSILATKINIGQ